MDSIIKLLSEYHFDVCQNIPNHLKCTKCQNIINNAKQIPCGCRFCSKCLIELIDNGIKFCPGMTDICKESNLSESHIDYSINRDISNIVIKCPFQCNHEDKLIKMDDHLMVCPKKGVKCVFYSLGCGNENLIMEKIYNHLQSDCYEHMKMLMSTIENMKNEIENMKEENESRKNENESRKNEIESMKEENENMKNEIEKMKKENEDRKNKNEAIEQEIKEINEENQVKFEALNREIELMHKGGRLVMTVDRLEERKKNNEYIRSKYFNGERNPYKMSIKICLNGKNKKGTHLSIEVFIWYEERNDTFKWPFIANVTMNIRNKNALTSQTKKVEMTVPEKDSFCVSIVCDFEYCDLISGNLLADNFMIVECIVDEWID